MLRRQLKTAHAQVESLTQRTEAAEERVRQLEAAPLQLPWNAKRHIDALYDFDGRGWKRHGKLEFCGGEEVELKFKDSGTYGAVYACNYRNQSLAVKVEIRRAKSNFECIEQDVSQELHMYECARESGMLKVQCVYHDTTWHAKTEYARNVYLMPLLDGLVRDLYVGSMTKTTMLRHILRVTRDQLRCMFSSGQPYIDLKLENLMYKKPDSIYIVDFGSMAGETPPITFPLPTTTASSFRLRSRTEALDHAEEWIAWQLGVVAFQVAVDEYALSKYYYWKRREEQGWKRAPLVKETYDLDVLISNRLPDDPVMQNFIRKALNGEPVPLHWPIYSAAT